MISFKKYIKENNKMLFVSQQDMSKFDSAIQPYQYTVKNATQKKTVLIVRAQKNDRDSVKRDIEEKLSDANIDYEMSTTGGSVGSTIVSFGPHKIQITYKPISGGMSETTLNSTITELVPSLAFMSKKKFSNIDDLYDFISGTSLNEYGVYVNSRDAEAGKQFIEQMSTSSKYKEKMENALAILDYLNDLHKQTPISQVFWGYRAKPPGIPASHKGDLFIKFKNGNMLGVSLKAGGEKTAEPQLNTYVNKFFDDFGYAREKKSLQELVHKNIHSKLLLPSDWESRTKKRNSIKVITEFKKKNSREYESMYDQMLEIVRDGIIKAVNLNKANAINYIQKQVLKKDDNVPLVVVKAFGSNYKMVTDEDDLEAFLPKIRTVKAYKSSSSKQNWFIELSASPSEKITMNMSVRSNKSPPENKISQGFNLAIKFNGIK
jgi:hypothetical protein